MSIFNKDEYQKNLILDLNLIHKDLLASSENGEFTLPIDKFNDSKSNYLNIQDNVYRWFYKRKYLYQNELKDVKPFREDYFKMFKNHERDFSEEWTPESAIDPLGRIIVSKNNYEKKILLPGTFLNENILLDIDNPQTRIKVQMLDRGLNVNNIDSYVHFFGETISDELSENKNILRLYFNFNPNSKTFEEDLKDNFGRTFFLKLNRRKIPFHIKISTNPEKFYADNVVLYLERRYLIVLLDIIFENYARIKGSLRNEVPMFTYKITDGISFAEGIDPKFPEESFGKRMSSTVVKMCESLKSNLNPTDNDFITKLQALHKRKDCFLFLNSESQFEYNYPKVLFNDISKPRTTQHFWLNIAVKLGYSVCREAFWDDKGRCNWIGFKDSQSYSSLSLEYMNGLTGILLFLVELFSASHKPLFKRFGIGLVQTILDKIKKQQYQKRGFYDGIGGIIFVLQKATIVFEITSSQDTIDELIENTVKENVESEPYDVYGGTAGTLWGLLLTKQLLGEKFINDDIIVKLKHSLMLNELWKTDTYFNKSINTNHERMVGFAHGVTGIVYVLALYQQILSITDDNINSKIEEAITFENTHRRFNNLWIDATSKEGDGFPPITNWDIGLSGIGFSRLGFLKIFGRKEFETDITLILEYCKKENFLNTFSNQGKGILDFYLSCNQALNLEDIQIKITLEKINKDFKNDILTLTKDNVKGNFVHPGLIGVSGLGLSLLRLDDSTSGMSYILPL